MANHFRWEQVAQILPPPPPPPPPQQHNNIHYNHNHGQHQHQLPQIPPLPQLQQQQQQQQHRQIQAKGRTTSSNAPAKPAQAPKSSKSTAPSDTPSFTFIDHDDDLASKRIKDANARKAIRSHVMRDVRRRERLLGLKRTSKRGAAKDKTLSPTAGQDNTKTKTAASTTKNQRKITDSTSASASASGSASASARASVGFSDADGTRDIDSSSLSGTTTMSVSPTSISELWMIGRSPSGDVTSAVTDQDDSDSPYVPSLWANSPTWAFDPFGTLPGSSPSTNTIIDGLIKYFSAVLIPMTFPAENKQPQDSTNRMSRIINATIREAGPFFGYMSLCAAHRAILQGKTPGLMSNVPGAGCNDDKLIGTEYYMMKARCIDEMNKKITDPAMSLTDSAFDIVVSLTSCALTIGDFDEARTHIKGLKRMVDLRGGVYSSSFQGEGLRVLTNVLTCDVMAASALMTRPLFPLTWPSQQIPPETEEKMLPPPTSPLFNTGMALCANEILSAPLRKALKGLRKILFFEHASGQNPANFSAVENEIFVYKSHEMQHELLDYPYRLAQTTTNTAPTSATSTSPKISLQPLEAITRIAAICHINHFFIVSPPSSGLGRALTRHLSLALSMLPTSTFPSLPSRWLDLFAWAAFLGARGARGQKTKPWFLERLKNVARVRGWIQSVPGPGWSEKNMFDGNINGNGNGDGDGGDGWQAVEEVLKGYLYIPELQGKVFREIWEEAMEGPVVWEIV
ncbi:hypothetical protein GX51_07700 [Blastomyces parvus]|uniref:Tachykinin family protein n=1 Tax=Blastomyces parvus TaxID=2060905 RepID=A0A2B7WJL7_9EURO|nr:hypothetical protein GX51_07700 [Blastomyces parvus]